MEHHHSDTPTDQAQVHPGEDGRLLVRFPYSQERVEKIKTISGRKWESDIKCWSIPRRKEALEELAGKRYQTVILTHPYPDFASLVRAIRRLQPSARTLAWCSPAGASS